MCPSRHQRTRHIVSQEHAGPLGGAPAITTGEGRTGDSVVTGKMREQLALTIESTLTRTMYIKVLLLLMLRSWGFRVFVAVAIVAGIMSATTGNYLFFAIFVPAVVVLYAVQVFAAVRSPKNRSAFLPATFEFTDGGIAIKKKVSKNTLKWESVVKWKRVGQYYLVYGSKHGFLTIPKSRIPDGRADAFEALLRRKIRKN